MIDVGTAVSFLRPCFPAFPLLICGSRLIFRSSMSRSIPFLVLFCASALVFPATVRAQSLRGSRTSVDRMYQQALRHDLSFFENASRVRTAASGGSLVRMSGNGDYELANVSHAYVLPATRTFVHRLASQYRGKCGEPLVITSLLRPTSQRLANSTAKSVHPTGMAVDLRKPRNGRCLTWLRSTLVDLEAEGVIEATEEHRPPHFHVAVFPDPYSRYVGGTGGERTASAPAEKSTPVLAVPARAASKSAKPQKYTVRRGDSIWSIARRTNVTVGQIKSANNLRSSRIDAGQVLVIPAR